MFSLSFQNPHHLQQLKLHNLVYLLLVAQIQNVVWSVEAHLVSVDQITLEVHQTVGQNVQLILTVLLVKPAWEKSAQTPAQVLAVRMPNVWYSVTFLYVPALKDILVILLMVAT